MASRRAFAHLFLLAATATTVACAATSVRAQQDVAKKSARETMVEQALRLRAFAVSEIANDFLDAVPELPPLTGARVVYRNRATRDAIPESKASTMSEAELEGYTRLELDEEFYYFTMYGTPLAFVRPLDLIGRAGLESLDGARVADFGFGSVGQLRLMAANGASTHGIDVDPLLGILYGRATDTGPVLRAKSAGAGESGEIAVHIGQWPGDAVVAGAVGGDYDAFISKNTLKAGYIHPAEEVDPRMLVHLGVDDDTFVRAVYDALKPGGLFMINNLCPPQSPDQYIPWADGRSPFPRALLEKTGFRVLAFDRDDTEAAREMGALLGWGDQTSGLDTDLFGTYTLARK
jgi:hypothetical protein